MHSRSDADLNARLTEASELIERGELRREHTLVDDGTRLLTHIIDELSPDHPQRARVFSLLGAGRLRLFDLTGDAAVLDEAVKDLANAVELTATSAASLAGRTFNLADAHITRYDLTGALPDLDMAICLLRGLTAGDPAEQAEYLIALGGALVRRFEREAAIESLDEASVCLREGIRLGSDPNWSGSAVGGLAAVAAHQARLRHDSAPIDGVVAFLRGKLSQPDGLPVPAYQCHLGSLLLERHRLFDDADALAEGATLLRRGLIGLESDSPDRPAFLARLATILGISDTGDPDEAASLLREAVRTAPPRDRYRSHYRANLAKLLLGRFARLRDAEALGEAIHLLENVVAEGSAEPAANPQSRLHLADALLDRFRLFAQEDDLARAIVLYQELRDSTDAADPALAFYLSRLGDALVVRYTELEDVPALYEAEAVRRKTIEVAQDGDPNMCSYHERLGVTLLHVGRRDGQEASLASAVDALRTATTTADPAQLATIHGELGVALAELSKHGSTGTKTERLAEAADDFREAARMTDPSSRSHRGFLSDLAEVLHLMFKESGRIDHLEEAISTRRELARILAGDADLRDQNANRARLTYLQKVRADHVAGMSGTMDKSTSRNADSVDDTRPRVFLSYGSEDRAFARRVQRGLRRAGVVVFLDELGLVVGERLQTIEVAISNSHAVVIVVSPASIASPWVNYELEVAAAHGIPILPAILHEVLDPLPEPLAGAAHADFRRPVDYRRSLQRLLDGIRATDTPAIYVTAKEAIAAVRRKQVPAGDLFGVSQQGVAILYSLTNSRDWEIADAMNGSSRMWIIEFYHADSHAISSFSVVDGIVRDLPTMHVLHSVPVGEDEFPVVTYSTAFDHEPAQGGLFKPGIGVSVMTKLDGYEGRTRAKSFARFQPIPILQQFVDSDTAVAAALVTGRQAGVLADDPRDLLVLTKLECDKRNSNLPTWIVAFFDPTITESIWTVGVNALDGTVRNPLMQAEPLNADFMDLTIDGSAVTIRMARQKLLDTHVWDIPLKPVPPTGLTIAEAIDMTVQHLANTYTEPDWQFGFVSNTGATSHVLSDQLNTGGEALIQADGRAGQWVVEVFSLSPQVVHDDERGDGYAYHHKRIVCTRSGGAVESPEPSTLVLPFPLNASPLPTALPDRFEAARRLALRSVSVDVAVMSGELRRKLGGVEWYFRCYDSSDIVARRTVSGDGMRVIE